MAETTPRDAGRRRRRVRHDRDRTPRAAGSSIAAIETIGNRLPDPAVLFLLLLVLTWIVSAILSPVEFAEIDPRNDEPMRIANQLTGTALATFLVQLVPTFTGFAPLGVVLVALLGVGVAEKTGFINAGLKLILGRTSRSLLTPMLILAAIVSHSAADAGYVLVIPLGGVIFYAAGRHPLAGISAAFAGVSGGFSANFIPSGIDPLLQGFTQQAAQILDASRQVNPLSNLGFTSLSSLLVIGVGWYLTDRVIEPRLQGDAGRRRPRGDAADGGADRPGPPGVPGRRGGAGRGACCCWPCGRCRRTRPCALRRTER